MPDADDALQPVAPSRDRYRTMIEVSPDACFVVRHGVMIFANPAAIRMFGAASANEIVGHDVLEFIDPAYHTTALERRRLVLELGAPAPIIEMRFLTVGGAPFDVEIQATLIEFDGERATFSGMRDVSARKRAERELRRSESRFRTLFSEAPLGVAVVDAQTGTFIETNQRFSEMLGHSRAALASLDRIALTHADDRQTHRGLLQRLASSALASFTEELRFVHADGSIRWLQITVAPLTVAESARAQQVLLAADVTQRRDLEAQFRRSQKLEAVGRLAGGVAHDFNNTLAAILGHAEFALHALEQPHAAREDIVGIVQAAQRSADLTRGLLTYARKQQIFPRTIDTNTAIEGLMSMLRRLLGERITLRWEPGADVGQLEMDPSQLDQVVTNLVVNARDAIEDVGTIVVRTADRTLTPEMCTTLPDATPGTYVAITVEDDGHGIPDAIREHIFEPFFTTKSHLDGSGLGLSTVYGILRQNGGLIQVRSAVDSGSTFDALLPRRPGRAADAPQQTPPGVAPAGSETILVVEDEPEVLRLTARALRLQGYTVLEAAHPEIALQTAREHAAVIDLVLSDVMMPTMNGPDLVRGVAAMRPQIRTLFMSGYSADLIARHGVLGEDTAFIAKPFTLNALAAKVRAVLDSAGTNDRPPGHSTATNESQSAG